MSFRIGDKVGDHRIVGVVGAGGAGRVFRVEHRITGRVEAMKVLLEGRGSETEAPAARFLREIKLQASLDHPNLASVHNAFWASDELVMIMELVNGVSLDRVIAGGRMPMGKVLRYAMQSLIALEYAHGRGITHRDIKPENIMVTPEGVVKLMDFGLAKDRNDSRMTETGIVVGSLFYISPEQARGLPTVDHLTDVYSFGSVLYEMTTGERPFNHNTSFELLQAAVNEDPCLPSDLAPEIPPALETVILRAMAKDPAARFQSAREFRRTLEGIVRNPGIDVATPAPAIRTKRRRIAMRTEGRRQNAVRTALLAASFLALSYMAFRALADNPKVQAALPIVEQPAPGPEPPGTRANRDDFILRETLRLENPPGAVAYSRGGDTLAVGLENGNVRTWNTRTGAPGATLSGGQGRITSVALDAAGRRVAAIDAEGSALLWDSGRGGTPQQLGSIRPAELVRFSENGERVAVVAHDGTIFVSDLSNGESWSFQGSKRVPKSLAFSTAGPLMAVSDAGKISLWGVGLTDKREELRASGPEPEALAFSSNGLELAAGIGRQIVTWDMPTRRAARTYSLNGNVLALAHAAGRGWVAVTEGAGAKELRVWRVHEGRAMSTIRLRNSAALVALSTNGERLAAATAEAEIYCWDTLPPPRH